MHDQAGLTEVTDRKIVIVMDEQVLLDGTRANVLALYAEAAIFLIERETVAFVRIPNGHQVVVGFGVGAAADVVFFPEVGDVIAVVIFRDGQRLFRSIAKNVRGVKRAIIEDDGDLELSVRAPVIRGDRDGRFILSRRAFGALAVPGYLQ